MSKVKEYLQGLVEKIHPDDFEAQDALFLAIVNEEIPLEEAERMAENSQPREVQRCGSE